MNGDGYGARDGRRGRDYQSSRDDRRDRDRDRRRSRSPHDYRGSRRRDGDVDAYSSSRSHRDREREDRYSGRERGGGRDREWDRDRSGRHNRRDDDDHRRRDRDVFEDRRRGAGRESRANEDRDRHQRTISPPPKKREPTPDLTNVVSILDRKRRLTQWDIKPPGYENVTAEQAKLSGMFPLPGAPRQQPVDPSRLQAFMSQPGGQVSNATLKPTNSRQSKRLLVYNISPSATEEGVMSFFNLQLNGMNIMESSDPCTLAQISKDHTFAVVEFRNSTDATLALALDGIEMEAGDGMANGSSKGHGLSIRRPKDYIVPAVVDDLPYEAGVVSSIVVDTPNKISVTNIPAFLTDEQVTELLVAFGELKAFVLVKDRGTEESRGIAFCEYADPAGTDIAIQGLSGMEVGGQHLKVQKASVGITQVSGVEMGVNAMSMLAGTTSSNTEESTVLQLLNMVTAEELMDEQDYEEICEDVKEECSKFGQVTALQIPRPVGGSRQSSGVGKIFIKFDTRESATKALRALAGRKFSDRTVVTTYFPEENFEVGAW